MNYTDQGRVITRLHQALKKRILKILILAILVRLIRPYKQVIWMVNR